MPLAYAVSLTLYDHANDSSTYANLIPPTWFGQTIKPSTNYMLKVIQLNLYHVYNASSPTHIENITVGIAVYDSAKNITKFKAKTTVPTANLPRSAPAKLVNFTLPTAVLLFKGQTYYIVIYTNGTGTGEMIHFRVSADATAYPDGKMVSSTDGGKHWSDWGTKDMFFACFGTPDPSNYVYQFLPVLVLLIMLGVAVAMMQKLSKG